MSESSGTTPSRNGARLRELRLEFAQADSDHDGRIDFAEFRRLLEDLDAGMSARDMQIGFGEVDTDRDGFIDCREFIEWWTTD